MPRPRRSDSDARNRAPGEASAAALDGFYATARGKALAEDVLAFVKTAWGRSAPRTLHFLGFGFPPPALKSWVQSARTFALLTPPFIGPVPWREGGVNKSAVVDEARLAIRESCFDRVLVFHAIEHMDDPVSFLEEIWRVTAPGGRAIFLLPRRGGAFSPSRFKAFLSAKGFMPAGQGGALFGLAGNEKDKPKLCGLFKALNPKSGLFGAAYYLIEAEKRQDDFGAAKVRALKAIRARPIPS